MIIMDLTLNSIFGFMDFHINFSYPKKIVNSIIENEHLAGRPNFRYKKAVILMGANATGKTSLGKALLRIFKLSVPAIRLFFLRWPRQRLLVLSRLILSMTVMFCTAFRQSLTERPKALP